ncbi:MAG: signal peptidase I [Minisyncoccota bacterium]
MNEKKRETSVEDGEYLSLGSLLLEMVKVFLLAVVIIIPVRMFLFQPFFVQGSSMEPNFEDGQYLVVSEFGYKQINVNITDQIHFSVQPFKDIQRQDVAVFRYPKKPEQFFIKRVIGLPGEAVEIRSGKVIIYNTLHPEGFVLDEKAYIGFDILTKDVSRQAIGPDEYFVMGDNRTASYDSRAIGPIPRSKMIGRVLIRAWPIEQFSLY